MAAPPASHSLCSQTSFRVSCAASHETKPIPGFFWRKASFLFKIQPHSQSAQDESSLPHAPRRPYSLACSHHRHLWGVHSPRATAPAFLILLRLGSPPIGRFSSPRGAVRGFLLFGCQRERHQNHRLCRPRRRSCDPRNYRRKAGSAHWFKCFFRQNLAHQRHHSRGYHSHRSLGFFWLHSPRKRGDAFIIDSD